MWHFFPRKKEMRGNGAAEEAGQGGQVELGHQEDRANRTALGRDAGAQFAVILDGGGRHCWARGTALCFPWKRAKVLKFQACC